MGISSDTFNVLGGEIGGMCSPLAPSSERNVLVGNYISCAPPGVGVRGSAAPPAALPLFYADPPT